MATGKRTLTQESRDKISKRLLAFHRKKKRAANGHDDPKRNGGMKAPGRNGYMAARKEVDAMSSIVGTIEHLRPRSRGVVLRFVKEHFA